MKSCLPLLILAVSVAGCGLRAASETPTSAATLTATSTATPDIRPRFTATPDVRPHFTATPTPRPTGSCMRRRIAADLEEPRSRWMRRDDEARSLADFSYPIIRIEPSPDGSLAVTTVDTGSLNQLQWRAMLLVDRATGGLRWLHSDAFYDQNVFAWLPDGGFIWTDAEGQVRQWDGDTDRELSPPLPMAEIWLTAANTLIAAPCDWRAGLHRLDLASGAWEPIAAADGSADQVVRGYHQVMRNDRAGMLVMGYHIDANNRGQVFLWRVSAAMGEPARFVQGPVVNVIGTDAYFAPGNQIGDTPYWRHGLPFSDAGLLIDERDASFHSFEEVGIVLPTPPTYSVRTGETLHALFADGALASSYPGLLEFRDMEGHGIASLYMADAYRGVSSAGLLPDGLLIGVTTTLYPPLDPFTPGDVCPCGLIDWSLELR